jgi:hypothetical protein
MNRLYATFIGAINAVAREKDAHWPIIITTIDALTHPELVDYYNIDMSNLTRLLKSNRAMLQLEDEFFDWKLGPDRYTRLGRRYAQTFPTVTFMIDVNVVSEGVDPGTRFPTLEPTGAELVQIYQAASGASAGVAFYSEHSVRAWDWPLMPYAMAARARATWGPSQADIVSPYAVALAHSIDGISVDGRPWGCGNETSVLLPAGKHTVRFGSAVTDPMQSRLTALSGELTGCQRRGDTLRISYRSTARCLLRFDKQPGPIAVDRRRTPLTAVGAAGRYMVFAPAGAHTLEVNSPTR